MLLQVLPRRIARGEGPYNLLPRVRRRRRVLRWWWIVVPHHHHHQHQHQHMFFFFPLQKEHGVRFSQGAITDGGTGDFGYLPALLSLCASTSARPSTFGSIRLLVPAHAFPVEDMFPNSHRQLTPTYFPNSRKKPNALPSPISPGVTRRSDGGAPPPGESDGCAQRSLERTTQRTTLRVPSCGPKPGRE